MGKLSVVATPIGNLGDITLRALEVFKSADVIACEDTRVTKKLLAHYEVHTPTIAFHANSGEKGFQKIISLLEDDKHVALVSDAGTPGLSDPGLELVSVVRDYFTTQGRGALSIEAIPGPSALAAALSVAGLRAASFTFYGFLPLKKGRDTLFKEIAASPRASIFYESPHRIVKALQSLVTVLEPQRRIGVFRELTKMYEEHLVGAPAEVLQAVVDNSQKQKGEFVVIVEAA